MTFISSKKTGQIWDSLPKSERRDFTKNRKIINTEWEELPSSFRIKFQKFVNEVMQQ